MFKLIGSVVVCGFALYGLMKYLERTKSNEFVRKDSAEQTAVADDADETVGERGS